MPAISIDRLTVEYSSGGYAIRPLDQFSLAIPAGSLVILLGPSGCGKTTLLSSLGGMLTPQSGTIHVGDIEVTSLSRAELTRYRRGSVGFVFQSFNLVPSMTARENVMVPLRAAGTGSRQARQRAHDVLAGLGLADRVDHRPGDLSGGQRQRVAIARALALDPPLLIADEPTANLDYSMVEDVLRQIRALAADDRIVIVATHDERLIPIADQVVEMVPRYRIEQRDPERIELAAGQVLFGQGDPSDLVYVVEEGSVDIVRRLADGSEELRVTLGPSEYFGELGPYLGLQRSATARASTDAVVTGYTMRDFRDRVRPEGIDDLLGGGADPRPD